MATLFSTALLIGGPWLYRALGGEGEILAAALAYSNAIFAGALAYWVLGALTSVVRGTGQPGVLAIVYIAAELMHIALVPILVFGWGPVPPLGVAGAGIATVTSFTASAGALFWWLASGRTAVTLAFRGVRFERRLFDDILRVGLPMSLQPILVNVTLAVLTGFVGLLGVGARGRQRRSWPASSAQSGCLRWCGRPAGRRCSARCPRSSVTPLCTSPSPAWRSPA